MTSKLRDYLWPLISVEENRKRLAFAGVLISAIFATGWTIFTYFDKKETPAASPSVASVPLEEYRQVVEELTVVRVAVKEFYRMADDKKVQGADLEASRRQIQSQYNNLNTRVKELDLKNDEAAAIASKVLTESVEFSCSSALAKGKHLQIVAHQFEASSDFSNCDFDGSAAKIDGLMATATEMSQGGNPLDALVPLGGALHVLQSFYAHSNYIELSESIHPNDYSALIPLRLWTASGKYRLKELRSKGLMSGTVFWSSPKLCPPSSPSHNEVNKDSPQSQSGSRVVRSWGNRTLYSVAGDLAFRESEMFLAAMLDRFPEVAARCHAIVPFVLDTSRSGESKGSPSSISTK